MRDRRPGVRPSSPQPPLSSDSRGAAVERLTLTPFGVRPGAPKRSLSLGLFWEFSLATGEASEHIRRSGHLRPAALRDGRSCKRAVAREVALSSHADRIGNASWTEVLNSDSEAYGDWNVGNARATLHRSNGALNLVLPTAGQVVFWGNKSAKFDRTASTEDRFPRLPPLDRVHLGGQQRVETGPTDWFLPRPSGHRSRRHDLRANPELVINELSCMPAHDLDPRRERLRSHLAMANP